MSNIVRAKFAASEVAAPNSRGIFWWRHQVGGREKREARAFSDLFQELFFCYALTNTKPAVVALIIFKSASIQRQNKMAILILYF